MESDKRRCCKKIWVQDIVHLHPLIRLLSVLLKDGEKYAFIGKPCDVNSFEKDILGMWNKNIEKQIVFTMAFSVPVYLRITPNDKLLEAVGCDKRKLSTFHWRGKWMARIYYCYRH